MRIPASGAAFLLAVLIAAVAPPAQSAAANQPFCPEPTHASPQKVPADLLATVAQAFHIDHAVAATTAAVRCIGPKLVACYDGANLNCDKADTRRTLPGATTWCREHPGSTNIPMAATGHATIYDWSCSDRRAVAGKIIVTIDPHGYGTDNWIEIAIP
jgi:hypothetical protein